MNIFLVYLRIHSHHDSTDCYNYGLGYIAAILKSKGHEVSYIVLKDKGDLPDFYQKVKSVQPEVIGLSITTCHLQAMSVIAKQIKSVSNSFVVCGGAHPTFVPESVLQIDGIDAIVRGEGEYPMVDLVDALQHNRSPHTIKNVWVREGEDIFRNELRPMIPDLDDLPFPDKHSLNYQRALDEAGGHARFIFSRGCTFSCAFCSNKALTELYEKTFYRFRTPLKAIAEIDRDARSFKFNTIIFDDDTIHLNPEWFSEFFSLYKSEFRFPFACNVRADFVTRDMVQLLKEAGAYVVTIGVEHGNEAFRKSHLEKNVTNQQIINSFDLFDRHGIKAYAQVMVGLPFETPRLFLDTVKLCRKLPLTMDNDIYIYAPYPGTKLGKICEEKGWMPEISGYQERSEAVISFPWFKKKEIQWCRDHFPSLTKWTFIPLQLPLGLLRFCFSQFYHNPFIRFGYRLSRKIKGKSHLYAWFLENVKQLLQKKTGLIRFFRAFFISLMAPQ